jgi:hypothetical protein
MNFWKNIKPLLLAILIPGMLWGLTSTVMAEPGTGLSNESRCQRGSDRACRSVGMEAQKAGDYEKAYDYLKITCENHPPRGALFPCSNYFVVAQKLNRLDTAPSELEAQCGGGDKFICYHLAKAYIAVELREDAHRILEPLCNENFSLPFKAAFGPCMDLGRSLEAAGNLEAAAYTFKLDCDRDTNTSNMSCSLYEYLENKMHPKVEEKREPIIVAFLLVLAMPVVSLILFYLGGRRNLKIIQWLIPVMIILNWAVWESGVGSYDIRIDLLLILPAVGAVILMAILARRKLKKSEEA